MKTPHPEPLATPKLDIECPWCAGHATIDGGQAGTRVPATFICETCSVAIVVAQDPVRGRLATAA